MTRLGLLLGLAGPLALAACATGGGVTPAPIETSTHIAVHVYWAVSNPDSIRLIGEDIDVAPELADSVSLVSALVSGDIAPLDHDYTNLWANGTTVNSVTVDGDLATVDLSLQPLNVGAESESIALAQIVWTISDADPSIDRVQFTVNGAVVESLAGHVDASVPIQRGDGLDTLTSVTIAEINDGVELTTPITFRGEACTVEAAVAWEILQGTDIVDSGTTIAEQACPARSEWTLEVKDLDSGDYTLVVRDLSPKDGSIVAEDSKSFTVK